MHLTPYVRRFIPIGKRSPSNATYMFVVFTYVHLQYKSQTICYSDLAVEWTRKF